jgi:hypothetical protein
MPKPIIKQEQKQENFDAIAPQKNHPALITTNGEGPKKRLGALGALFLVLFLAAVASAAWLYWQYAGLRRQVEGLEAVNENTSGQALEGVSLLDKINQHILLPHDQEPKITTIENSQELKKTESFYEYAQDGDSLVQFNSLEIIYNPVADVIVNARTRGTVAGTEIRAVQGAITIDIRNGAGRAGLASKTSETFKGVKDFIVQSVGNAAKTDYSKTMLVNLSDKDVAGLEKQFNVQAVKDLPAGEQPSTADVVIILGRS